MPSAGSPIRCYRYSLSNGWSSMDTRIITEASVSLTVNGENWLTFTCTPMELDALALGFLFNENVIQSLDEVSAVDICRQATNVDIWLRHTVNRPDHWQRTSGCTGGLTTQSNRGVYAPIPSGEKIDPETLLACMEQLLEVQELYRESRGIHCSAISDGQTILARAEDIGRHNTLDKLAGRVLLDRLQARPVIVITTGRVSSEMLQKSARLGAAAVVSRTSPTSESIRVADQSGITLVGYARRNQFIVYTHSERLGKTQVLESAEVALPPAILDTRALD